MHDLEMLILSENPKLNDDAYKFILELSEHRMLRELYNPNKNRWPAKWFPLFYHMRCFAEQKEFDNIYFEHTKPQPIEKLDYDFILYLFKKRPYTFSTRCFYWAVKTQNKQMITDLYNWKSMFKLDLIELSMSSKIYSLMAMRHLHSLGHQITRI